MTGYTREIRIALSGLVLATLLLCMTGIGASPVFAQVGGDWVITVNYNDLTVHTVNAATNTVYGPFLTGQLGAQGEKLLDVSVTPDGTTAIVSNFSGRRLYFIDVSNRTAPSLLGSTDFSPVGPPLDVAITHDGQFALITDGSLGTWVASVDIASRTLVDTVNLGGNKAHAVAVAPNGTVIVAGASGSTLDTITIDAAGNLSLGTTYTEGLSSCINVGVAPDGETVIVCNLFDNTVAIYQVTGLGALTYKGTVGGLPGDQGAVAFSAAGDKAYVVSVETSPDKLSVLDITAPGTVSLNTAGAADLLSDTAAWFLGVDPIAVAAGGAYVGNPCLDGTTTSNLALVDLTGYGVNSLAVGDFPVGVAAFSQPQRPVGGTTFPLNRFAILSPLAALAALILFGVLELSHRRRAGLT